MGFLSHRVERNELEAGDHIYTWRTAYIYSHHGIYIGRDKVVHFTQHQNSNSGDFTSFCSSSFVPKVQNSSSADSTSFCSSSSASKVAAAAVCLDPADCGFSKNTSGVVMSCLNCFLGNGSLYRFQYGVRGLTLIIKVRPGICTTAKSDPPEDVIHRAMYLLDNGYGKYDLLSNNCEDFALYCKTGLVVIGRKGSQGSGSGSGQASSLGGVFGSLILSLPSKIFSSNPYVFGVTTLGTYTFGRYANDIGVMDNVHKVEVEFLVALHSNLPAKEDACADGVGIAEDWPKKHGNLPAEEDACAVGVDVAEDQPAKEDACGEGVDMAEDRPKKHGNLPAEEDACAVGVDITEDQPAKEDACGDGVVMAEDRPKKHGNLPAEEDACAVGVDIAEDQPAKEDACGDGVVMAEDRPKKHGNLPAEEDAFAVGVDIAEDQPAKEDACGEDVDMAEDRPKKHGNLPAEEDACAVGVDIAEDQPRNS